MIRRLVEANYGQNRDDPTNEQICFWLEESRTPEILLTLAAAHPDELTRLIPTRPLLASTESQNSDALEAELEAERLQAAELVAVDADGRPMESRKSNLHRLRVQHLAHNVRIEVGVLPGARDSRSRELHRTWSARQCRDHPGVRRHIGCCTCAGCALRPREVDPSLLVLRRSRK